MARRKNGIDGGNTPLIVEPHPVDYNGLPFLTLIQYRKQHMLTIIDTVDAGTIRAYVLDLCGAEEVEEDLILNAARDWYESDRGNFPLSIAFSRKQLTPASSKIYRSLNIEFISRVIGPLPHFPMRTIENIKRRRRRALPPSIEIHNVTSE